MRLSICLLGAALILVLILFEIKDFFITNSVPTCDYNLSKQIALSIDDTGVFEAPLAIIEKSITDQTAKGLSIKTNEMKNTPPQVFIKGFSFKQDARRSACVEKINLDFYNQSDEKISSECYALAYLRQADKQFFSNLQAMKCDEIFLTLGSWVKLNNVKETTIEFADQN